MKKITKIVLKDENDADRETSLSTKLIYYCLMNCIKFVRQQFNQDIILAQILTHPWARMMMLIGELTACLNCQLGR